MHEEAHEGFGMMLSAAGVDRHARFNVLDLGGQNVNGNVYDWLDHPDTTITTLDIENADIIADATTWTPDRQYDMVIATEVFEHVENWRDVVKTAVAALRLQGAFVATCASTHRVPHGMSGDSAPGPGEWYGNVAPEDLKQALSEDFQDFEVVYRYPPGDAYMWAVK